ncbi:amidohydrolase family protein [Streptomyces sp. BE147]|uniref:amidohydrolase family protein n=1 Tax=unclassified Streptomyces TaxID=2593676 RepID=UPI002E75DB15|nr:amidohydrolase family protein [Streptomyces sp. BE147]MEE1736900.1 amidohydrolase family protein [Streptomyces sp. BE147]
MSGTQRTLVTGGHVITMDDEYGELPEGGVLIENGRITAIGRGADDFTGVDAEVIDAQGGFILPGMVDSHRHTWMALLRAISADQSLMEFLARTFYGIGSLVRAEDLGAASMVGALEALDAGVTTIFDCCDCVNSPDHARAGVEALRASGIRSVYAYGMQVYDFRPASFTGHEQRLGDAAALRSEYFASDSDLSRMGMLFSDFGTVPFEDTAREIRTARELGVKAASHTGAATSSILLRGLRELNDRDLLLPEHLHIHCPALNDEEWRLLADTGGKVTIAPETEMQMGMGYPPFRAALAHGLAPGISTDIVCVGSGDLFSQMRLGLQFQRCLDHDPVHRSGRMPATVGLSVRDALTWATRNSAAAIGLGDQVGSLTPGKRGDVIVVRPRMDLVRSSYPAGSVVLQSAAADVDTVLVDGVARKRHGKLVGQDLAAVRRRAESALDHLQTAAASLPGLSTQDIYGWFTQAERLASVNFSQAYGK